MVQGRLIGPEEVALIGAWLASHPLGNRTRLSHDLCSLWDWRNHAGRLKDMACRSLLLRLEVDGLIRLPPRRTASVNALRNRSLVPVPHDRSPIHDPLAALRPLQLEPLAEQSSARALFKFLLQSYHYLGHRNGVGEKLHYLARDHSGRPLACLVFGSAVWHLRPRDRWIGWNPEQRRRHLFLLTNNTRWLLLPWVRVPQLASHLLAEVTARLSADWQQKYGHPIHLLETFVEPERFTGLCYAAAGWRPLGATTGRVPNPHHPQHTARAPVKQIYVKPLVPDFRRRLAA